jgi:hypothetical protein
MKIALTLLIIGVIILAVGVGTWVDATTPVAKDTGGAGLGAGLTVFGLAMTAGGAVMIALRRKR